MFVRIDSGPNHWKIPVLRYYTCIVLINPFAIWDVFCLEIFLVTHNPIGGLVGIGSVSCEKSGGPLNTGYHLACPRYLGNKKFNRLQTSWSMYMYNTIVYVSCYVIVCVSLVM